MSSRPLSLSWAFVPPVIAHRGASAHAPENTMAAFKRAALDGATWMETDIKISHDGMPLLMHDDMLNRTTNGTGNVADTMWDVVRQLDAGVWFDPDFFGERVPQLSDFARYIVAHNLRVNLELKPCPGRTRATVMVSMIELAKLWPESAPPPLLSSFDDEALMIAGNLHPEWPRGLLSNEWSDNLIDRAKALDAQSVHLEESLVTPERIALLKNAGLMVLAYVVNDAARAKNLLGQGVQAVFTDDPAAILKGI